MKNIYELFEDFFQKKLTPEELESRLREQQGEGQMSTHQVTHQTTHQTLRHYLLLKKSTDSDNEGRWVEAGVFSGKSLREVLEKYFTNHPPVDLKIAEITQNPQIYPISKINKFLGK